MPSARGVEPTLMPCCDDRAGIAVSASGARQSSRHDDGRCRANLGHFSALVMALGGRHPIAQAWNRIKGWARFATPALSFRGAAGEPGIQTHTACLQGTVGGSGFRSLLRSPVTTALSSVGGGLFLLSRG